MTLVACLGVAMSACEPSRSVVITTPEPSPSPSMALEPTDRPTSELDLHVGGIAAVQGFSELRTEPSDTSGRETEGHLEVGSRVYLIAGPVRTAAIDWWQVHADLTPGFGWMPAVRDGAATLVPIDPGCPDTAVVTVDEVIGIGRLRSLACFGATPLSFEADVICLSGTLDGGPGGASWMDSDRWCRTVGDPGLGLYGAPITSTLGVDLAANPRVARFRITGHFDDAEARGCWNLPIGVSLDSPGQPEPDAVMACRERFVVTSAAQLD